MDLTEVQKEHKAWLAHNFPNHTIEQIALGCAEEAGELAHHVLKRGQNIRTTEDHVAGILDAIADFNIFAMGICDALSVDLEELIVATWLNVRQRDWVENPEKGVPV